MIKKIQNKAHFEYSINLNMDYLEIYVCVYNICMHIY